VKKNATSHHQNPFKPKSVFAALLEPPARIVVEPPGSGGSIFVESPNCLRSVARQKMPLRPGSP